MNVQDFVTWVNGEGDLNDRFVSLYNARAPPQLMLQEAAAHSVTQGQTLVQQNPIAHLPPLDFRVMLRASCQWRGCYRVMTVAHLLDMLRIGHDCLLCPAHQAGAHTHSVWVTCFYNTVTALDMHPVMVHDWNDVPGNPRMHWDCTLFFRGRAVRFEIDGPCHEPRHYNDVPKDAIVNNWQPLADQNSLVVVRMHFHDYDGGAGWMAAILQLLIMGEHELHGMFYTARYTHLLEYNPANDFPYTDEGLGEGVEAHRIL